MVIKKETDTHPKPPTIGIIYGKIAYWLAFGGVIITIIGSAIYLTSDGYFNKDTLFEYLWKGSDAYTIWHMSTGVSEIPHGYWYLGRLTQGDCLEMLGIAVACIAGVIGMWGVVYGLIRSKERIYIIFSLIVALVLTLSASGIITV